jgi:hypothetical protein
MSTAPSADAQGYLQDLMQAGQHAMKQFDDGPMYRWYTRNAYLENNIGGPTGMRG